MFAENINILTIGCFPDTYDVLDIAAIFNANIRLTGWPTTLYSALKWICHSLQRNVDDELDDFVWLTIELDGVKGQRLSVDASSGLLSSSEISNRRILALK